MVRRSADLSTKGGQVQEGTFKREVDHRVKSLYISETVSTKGVESLGVTDEPDKCETVLPFGIFR